MTAVDTALAAGGAHPRFFLRIDGYEPNLWQYVNRPDDTSTDNPPATSDGYTNNGLNCLRLPDNEWHMGLDLQRLVVEPSSMQFTLDNLQDSDGTYKFAKLFAPGRWNRSDQYFTYLRRTALDNTDTQVDADATTIAVLKNAAYDAMPSSGFIYIGQETIYYSGKSTTGGPGSETLGTFTNCLRGQYPAFFTPRGGATTTFGWTYLHNTDAGSAGTDEVGGSAIVSSVPYSWVGRRVALYVTTFDETNKDWHDEDECVLVWAGKIQEIAYDANEDGWRLVCDSILADLKNEIARDLPEVTMQYINLQGDLGRKFGAEIRKMVSGGDIHVNTGTFEIPQGYYTAIGLIVTILALLNDSSNWTVTPVQMYFSGSIQGGRFVLRATNSSGSDAFALKIYPRAATASSPFDISLTEDDVCLAWWALGVTDLSLNGWNWYVHTGGSSGSRTAPDKVYWHFASLNPRYNGSKMLVAEHGLDFLWSDQGDLSTAQATLYFPDGYSGQDEKEKGQFINYTAASTQSAYGSDYTQLTLSDQQPYLSDPSPYDVIASIDYDNPPIGKQVYWPRADAVVGPFKHLLRTLVSTGTSGYNGSYDILPATLGLAIPSALVDSVSFLTADLKAIINYPDLARGGYDADIGEYGGRPQYVITEPISWLDDFWDREAKLFGQALAWRNGKITVIDPFAPEAAKAEITLDDSNTVVDDDWYEVLSSTEYSINQWRFELGYDFAEDKYFDELVVNDKTSQLSMQAVHARELKHPGLAYTGDKREIIGRLIRQRVGSEMALFRVPPQVVKRTLAPTLFNRVHVGDMVTFQALSGHPDPFGSGTMTVDALALCLDAAWSLAGERPLSGSGTFLIFSSINASSSVVPWAPSALVDKSAANGGWDAVNYRLTLESVHYGESGDADDGSAFASGDKVQIRATHCTNPASPPASEGPFTATLASAYETDGAQIMTLTADPFGGNWSATTEYFVTFDDYDAVTTSQETRGAWMANALTMQLDNGGKADAPQKFG